MAELRSWTLSTRLARAARAALTRSSPNAGSGWGRHFPDFRDKETRLYSLQDMEEWVRKTGHLRMAAARNFRYARISTLERLLEQARNRHYSTFSLYTDAKFETACQTFEDAVRRRFDDPARITWHDENVLLQIERSDA